MNEKEKILKENIIEYYDLGESAFINMKYNSAATLFFKSIAALLDLQILRNKNIIPSSHTQRFRILQDNFPELYKLADRDFPFYQDSYTHKIDYETARLLKDDATRLKEMFRI